MDILIFAMIAAFLIYRLRSVLGRRHGEERQRPNPFVIDRNGLIQPDNVISLADRGRPPLDSGPDVPEHAVSLAAGIAQIRSLDPNFDEKLFVHGARSAFSMIVEAYARGETAVLRPLVSDDVYDSIVAEIKRRGEAGEHHEAHIERIKDADLLEARIEGRLALVTVKFVSEQVIVTRSAAGVVLDGDPDRLLEITDIWTFARMPRSKDPNWTLVETRTPN